MGQQQRQTTYGMSLYILFITLFLLTNYDVVVFSFLPPLRQQHDDVGQQ